MAQIINFDFKKAAYGGKNYGGGTYYWKENYYEIYAAREGPKSGSTYFMSKIEFVVPDGLKAKGCLKLSLTISRNLYSNFTSAILCTDDLSEKEIYDIDTLTEARALSGYIASCNGVPEINDGPKKMSYSFGNAESQIELESNTTYFIYIRRELGLSNEGSAEATASNNGFTAFYNPVKYPNKSSLSFEIAEEYYPSSEQIFITPSFVELKNGEEISQQFRLYYNDGTAYESNSINWSVNVLDENENLIETPHWIIDNGNGSYTIKADSKEQLTIQIIATWGIEGSHKAIVFIPSSKWSGLKDWLSGYMIGLTMMPHPVFVNSPIAFDYRGHQLPPFSAYDEQQFENICLFKEPVTNSTYIAYISSEPFIAKDGQVEIDINNSKILISQVTLSDESAWSEFKESEMAPYQFVPIWTNKNIKDVNDMIVFDTYQPTPIYLREVKR